MNHRLENTLYHSFLRIAICVFAVALVFDSGILLDTTAKISDQVQNQLASAVGVKVGVTPNEVNQLTGRITELERDLALKERIIAVNVGSNSAPVSNTSTFILSALLFIMLVLIVLNYALDYLRARPIVVASYEKNTSPIS
jgi:hypothetical protein